MMRWLSVLLLLLAGTTAWAGSPVPQETPSLAAEVAAAPECTFLFSGEHCHSRLVTPEEVMRLHGLLTRHFDEVRILVYLRRQDQVAVSHYSTLIKAGGTRGAVLDASVLGRNFLDYEKLLGRWSGAFGRDAMTVALFDRSAFVGGSIIPDFCARAGLPLLGEHLVKQLIRMPPGIGGPSSAGRAPVASRCAGS